MKKFIFLLIIICMLLMDSGEPKIMSNNIDSYVSDCESVENASMFMPDIADLGSYAELKYTYQLTCYSKFMGFYSDGLALFAKYDQETYEEQKEHALNSYTFLEAPVEGSSGTYTLPLTEFEYNDYLMKVIPDDDYIEFSACKSFMMLGLNDEDCVIAYLYYYDFDLDYIAESDDDFNAEMIELVDKAFSWVAF